MIGANGNSGLIQMANVSVHFPVRRSVVDALRRAPRQTVRAVDGVDLAIGERETLGLVGESGSGKTTLARTLVRIYEPSGGQIQLNGQALSGYPRLGDGGLCRRIQMVFQDPYSSLNPRKTVAAALGEVLRFHRLCSEREIPAEIARLLREVGLPESTAGRLPRSLSGGQRQRVGLARALAVKPAFIVLDEPVAALDVSIQAQILNLLKDLKEHAGVGMLLVAHELSVVRHMCDRVAVMYLGRIVEIGETSRHLRNAPPSLYREPAQGRAAAGAGAAPSRRRAEGRHPQPAQHSQRLPFPPPLPESPGHLPPHRPAGERKRRRPSCRLSFSKLK